MKDAQGHGSNGRGAAATGFGKRATPNRSGDLSGRADSAGRSVYRDDTSNAEAASALMGALRSTQAPVHGAMQFGSDRSAAGPSPYVTPEGRGIIPSRPFRQ